MRPIIAAALALLTAAGCGSGYDQPIEPPKRQVNPEAFGVVVDPALPPGGSDRTQEQTEKQTENQAEPVAPEAAPAQNDPVREEATVGVGRRGRGYGPGLVTTPIATYFRSRERITFTIQIPHALNLYRATTGEMPKTYEEFTEKIIKPNRIDLPDLPPGDRYIWDAEKGQLMIEHPGR